jgi:glycosyltransferase involved in cell wall biosynthesis
MKIGVLIDRLNVGGVEKIAIEQVVALRKAGHDATLVILREKAVVPNAFPDLLKEVPITYLDKRLPKFLRLSFRFPGFHFFSWFHVSYAFLLPFVVKKHEFDYFIVHGTYTSLTAVAMKKRRKIPFSSFIWDPASYILGRVYTGKFLAPVLSTLTAIATSFDKYLINNMDTVLVGGEAHNPFIHDMNPDKKIEVIYPSVHPSSRQSKKKGYILMVTAWKQGKNPEYIFEILKKLPNLHIKMVGKWVDPLYKTQFEQAVRDNGFDKQIDVVGAVSESELSKYYTEAQVLLQTNDDRGFGMPAIEAAGHGTTFIIPKGQGVCDLFTDKKDGFYTNELDTKKIVSLLERLVNDKNLATSMGKSALDRVKENYSWAKHAEKLVQLVNGNLGTNEKTMHVLFTGLVSPKMLSGGDQLFLDIAPRLPKDRRIIVVTPSFAKGHWNTIKQPNIEFRFLPQNRFEQNDNPLFIFLSYIIRSWQVSRILKREPVQTIYSCSDIAYADIWPAYWAVGRDHRIKWISRIYHVLLPPKERQGVFLTNIIAFKLQRLSFWMMKRRSSTIFALNKKLREEVLELGFPDEKLGILGAGIDFEAINSFKPIKKYDYDVAVLARIAPVKGIFDAVKIWKKVHAAHPNAKIAWIGGGGDTYKNQLNDLLKADSLQDSFHLMGFIEKDEAYSILKSAKIFLCTDHENGWGLAVCEAMASGLPVVSYDIDIFGSVYQKGFKSVTLFDTDSFANEIIKLLDDDKKRTAIAKDAVAQAKKFDHKQVIDDLVLHLDQQAAQ